MEREERGERVCSVFAADVESEGGQEPDETPVCPPALELTGTGISEAFGNCGEESRLVGLLPLGDLTFAAGIFGDEGEIGGLREDVELVGDDFALTILRESGVGILEADRGEVTGVVFVDSFAGQVGDEVAAFDSN